MRKAKWESEIGSEVGGCKSSLLLPEKESSFRKPSRKSDFGYFFKK